MVGLGEPMLDAMISAGPIEGMAAPTGGWLAPVLGKVSELDAIVCEYGVDFVGTASTSSSRKVLAVTVAVVAVFTNRASAYFEVRSMPTKR